MTVAYHASHEQFALSELINYCRLAEESGFTAIHSSDHFHPWSFNQGQSGFSFSWLPAAMQVTHLPFSMVCAPGQRYHAAIVAQAIATIGDLFPGRFSIELGSGEAINESITGDIWPDKSSRNQRLLECFRVIKGLLQGETVSYSGKIRIQNAKLFSLPSVIPSLLCAAISEKSCRWAGEWAGGLLTTGGHGNEVLKKINAFHNGGGDGPVFIQQSFSFGHNERSAIDGAFHQWRNNLLTTDQLANLSTVEEFDIHAEDIHREDVKEKMLIITDIEQLVPLLQGYDRMNVKRVILHNVSRNQVEFIDEFKKIASLFQ